MKFYSYLEEHAAVGLLQLFSMVVLGGYLTAVGTPAGAVFYVMLVWALAAVFIYASDFRKKRRRFREIQETMDVLEEKYLFPEVIKPAEDVMERLYLDCLREASKAMMDKIEQIQAGSREYKEYIESWIHEVKSPLAAVSLYCENHPSQGHTEILKEMKKMEQLVDQALYYARSGYTEKDYFVQNFCLADAVVPALQEYRTLILEKHISLDVKGLDETVYTDPKWVTYILGQLIANAVKYVEKDEGEIRLYTLKKEKGLWLFLEDNGCGITQADLPRVCEKGFTGQDRKKENATGMGLYLAKQLCEKLGLALLTESPAAEGDRIHKGTRTGIFFPAGTLFHP